MHPSDSIYRGKAYKIRHQTNTLSYATPQNQRSWKEVGTSSVQRASTITSNSQPNCKNDRTRITTRSSSWRGSQSSSSHNNETKVTPSCSSWRGSTTNRSLISATEKVRVPPQISSMPSTSNMKRRHHPSAPKFPTFDGSIETWRPFIKQYKEIAKIQNESRRTQLERLLGCLIHETVDFIERRRIEKHRAFVYNMRTSNRPKGRCCRCGKPMYEQTQDSEYSTKVTWSNPSPENRRFQVRCTPGIWRGLV